MPCPVCGRVNVPDHNMVCENCSPFSCQNCGDITAWAYKIRKPYNKLKEEAQLKMGWGITTSYCTKCKNYRTMGDSIVCFGCTIKELDKFFIVCHNCLGKISNENQWWQAVSLTAYQNCAVCNRLKVLNQEEICETCYTMIMYEER